jgi:hypothetical protein
MQTEGVGFEPTVLCVQIFFYGRTKFAAKLRTFVPNALQMPSVRNGTRGVAYYDDRSDGRVVSNALPFGKGSLVLYA